MRILPSLLIDLFWHRRMFGFLLAAHLASHQKHLTNIGAFPPATLVPALHTLHNTWQIYQHCCIDLSPNHDCRFSVLKEPHVNFCSALLIWQPDPAITYSIPQIVAIRAWCHPEYHVLFNGRVFFSIFSFRVIAYAERPRRQLALLCRMKLDAHRQC